MAARRGTAPRAISAVIAIIALAIISELPVDRWWLWVVVGSSIGIGAAALFGPGPVRRLFERWGLPRASRFQHLGAGVAIGAASMTAVVAIFMIADWYQIKPPLRAVASARMPSHFVGSVCGFFPAALSEELLLRRYLLVGLERRVGTWVALVTSSMLFGLLHWTNPHASLWTTVALALDMQLGAAYVLTRSLWLPLGIHFAWNVLEGPVLGLRVSGYQFAGLLPSRVRGPQAWTGGAFGPEGGLVATLTGVLLSVVLMRMATARGQILRTQRRSVLEGGA
jgi:hypothetical protein